MSRPRRSPGFGTGLILPALLTITLGACTGAATPAPAATASSSRAPATTSPTPAPTPEAPPEETPTPPPPTPRPTPAPTAAPTPGLAACPTEALAARITMWEGAAGSRIGTVEMTNAGTLACTITALARPQLVDANGAVLINGTPGAATPVLVLQPGDVVSTQVRTSNYCAAAPAVEPATLAFVFTSGTRVKAAPFAGESGVPPCMGDPGSPGTVEMHAWAR